MKRNLNDQDFLKYTIFALLVILMFTSCEKLNWESIELNDQKCTNGAIMMQFSNATGVVRVSDVLEQKYIDLDKTDDLPWDMKLYPCNMINDNLIVGKKIKISGIIYSRAGVDDSSLDEGLGQIVLTSAKYHK